MGQHEIRLRRKNMTSRRVEGYKNYYDIMRRHKRSTHRKQLAKTVVYILFFLGIAVMLYFGLEKLQRARQDDSGRNISYVSLKLFDDGKQKTTTKRCTQIQQAVT